MQTHINIYTNAHNYMDTHKDIGKQSIHMQTHPDIHKHTQVHIYPGSICPVLNSLFLT